MATQASHVWKPSSARTVVLDSFIPIPRGAIASAPPPLNWPIKDPADILDYQFDVSPALVGNDGDAIQTLDATVSPANPGDLTITSATADGPIAVFWLSGGQTGTIYTVTISVGTTNGRSIQRSILLSVLSLSTPAVSATALETGSGTMITDQNGNPILSS
jgi:hypothetical protein